VVHTGRILRVVATVLLLVEHERLDDDAYARDQRGSIAQAMRPPRRRSDRADLVGGGRSSIATIAAGTLDYDPDITDHTLIAMICQAKMVTPEAIAPELRRSPDAGRRTSGVAGGHGASPAPGMR